MTGWASRIRWGSLGVMLLVIGVRVLSEHARIPWWDFDPLVSPIPETRITPAMGMVMDAILVAASVGVVISEWLAGRRIGLLGGALVVIGAVGVGLHGFVLTPYGGAESLHGDARSLSIGATWSAAIAAGWALSMVARDRAAMSVGAGVVLGIVIPLAAIGAVQVFVEHAQMVRVFESDPESALMAAGITPGTPGAATFERRLRQAEATGPFGLANVFGTVAAAGVVFWGIVAVGAVRNRARGAVWIALVGLVASAAGLWLSASKGAIVAAVFGLAFVAVVRLAPRRLRDRRWIGAVVGVGLILVPMGVVVARGVVGERIGELSLLFRSHYAEAGGRIIADHPVFGVGPGNFKSAYLMAKNPLNPEQVESPHSVMLDWVSMLGVFGAAWSAALLVASGALGAGVWMPQREDSIAPAPDIPRAGRFLSIIVPISAGAAALLVAGGMVSPERAMAMTVGLSAWALVAWWCAGAARLDGWIALGGGGAAAVAIAHGQIEVTPIMSGSAAWWAAVVGLAVGAFGTESRGSRRWSSAGGLLVCACLVAWGAILGVRSVRLFDWERELGRAWVMASDPATGDSADRLRGIGQRLARAWRAEPGFIQVGQEAVRLEHRGASERQWTEADEVALAMVQFFPGRVEAWVTWANAAKTAQTVWEALTTAAELDPWSLGIAVRVAEEAHQRDDGPSVAKWARRALEIDEFLRLDPVVRLGPEERRRLEGWIASEEGPGGPEP